MSKHVLTPYAPKRRGPSRWKRLMLAKETMQALLGAWFICCALTVAAIIISIPWGQM